MAHDRSEGPAPGEAAASPHIGNRSEAPSGALRVPPRTFSSIARHSSQLPPEANCGRLTIERGYAVNHHGSKEAVMAKYTGGMQVNGGYYWNPGNWEVEVVASEGGRLKGP